MRRGVLEDVMERPVTILEQDPFTLEQKWFCLLKKKRDQDIVECLEYFSETKAVKVFETLKRFGKSNLLLVDVKNNKSLKRFQRPAIASSSPEKKVSHEDRLNEEAHNRGLLVKRSQKVIMPPTIFLCRLNMKVRPLNLWIYIF